MTPRPEKDLQPRGPGIEESAAVHELAETRVFSTRSSSFSVLAWQRFKRHRAALIGALLLVLVACSAVLAPWIAPYNPNYGDFSAFSTAPGAQHLLGTDFAGRDMLSRLLFGGRVSLLIGLIAMSATVTLGTLVGALAGYYGGWVDTVLMRFIDMMLSFPLYLLLFVLSAFLSAGQGAGGLAVIVLIIVSVSWTTTARLVRGEFLAIKELTYIEAARAIGVGPIGLIMRHMLPGAVASLVVNATLLVGNTIVLESVLSFFGFGVQPPTSSWGSMLADGLPSQATAPWETIAPGAMILLTVLCINLLGDGLRDALSPYDARSRS